MKRRTFNESDDAGTGVALFDDGTRALMCRMPGCRNRWTVDILHGKVCSDHDAALSRAGSTRPAGTVRRAQAAMPLREALPHFAEPADRDDEPGF